MTRLVQVEVLRPYPREGRVRLPGARISIPEHAVEAATSGSPPHVRVLGGPPKLPSIVDLLLPDAVALVQATDDAARLQAYHDEERANPKYKNGRVKLLDKIEERLGELTVVAPELPGRLAEEMAGEAED